MSQTKKKSQHYVPRFLLRRFSPDKRSIGTLVLETGQQFARASIAGQCARDYFYGRDPALEDEFGKIERLADSVLRVLKSDDLGLNSRIGNYLTKELPTAEFWSDLQAHPLHVLRTFVYLQHFRTARVAEDFADGLERKVKDMFGIMLAHSESNAPLDVVDLERIRIRIKNPICHVLAGAFVGLPIVLDLAVKILVARNPRDRFVIADHPVVVMNQYARRYPGGLGAQGMQSRGLQMFMPVSSDMAIAVYDPITYEFGSPRMLVASVGSKDVKLMNIMQASSAQASLCFDPRFPVDADGLRAAWKHRSSRLPCMTHRVIGTDSDGGMLHSSMLTVNPEFVAPANLSCVRVLEAQAPTYGYSIGEQRSYPIRSPELFEFCRYAQQQRLLEHARDAAPGASP